MTPGTRSDIKVSHSLQRIKRPVVKQGSLELTEPKTEGSRGLIALPQIAVSALYARRQRQDKERRSAGDRWNESGMVFTTGIGTSAGSAKHAAQLLRDHGHPRSAGPRARTQEEAAPAPAAPFPRSAP